MSSLRKFVDALLEKLDRDGRPCQYGNDLPSLEDLPVTTIRIVMEVEGLGKYILVSSLAVQQLNYSNDDWVQFTSEAPPQSAEPAGVGAQTSASKPRPPPRRISERKKPATITKSTIPSNHTSAPAGSCGSLKRGAPRGAQRPAKRQRTSNNEATTVTTSTRLALEPLDVNAIPISRPHPILAPKPKSAPNIASSRTTKEAPRHDTDIADDEDEQFDAYLCKDKAKDLYGMLLKAATSARAPGDHFRDPLRLRCGKKAVEEETTKKAIEIMERNAQLDDKSSLGRLSWISLCIEFAHLVYDELRKKGKTFDAQRGRPSRGNIKYGKWDVNEKELSIVIDDIFQVNKAKMHESDARRLMLETQKAEDYRLPGNYQMRNEALETW
jgi:hypothetical protein